MNNKDYQKRVRLSNGKEVLIRPITVADKELEWNFVHNLSQEARTYRFFGAQKDLTPQMLDFFTNIDYHKHMALIAVVDNQEIAVARFFCDEEMHSCEFAIVVDEKWQHLGLGGELIRSLMEIAKNNQIKEMKGDVIPQNQKMIEFVKELGFEVSPHPEDRHLLLARKKL